MQVTDDDISVREIYLTLSNWFNYFINYWWKIMVIGIIGAISGYIYAAAQPVKYIAKLSFIVEEGKSGGGGLATLAGQFGFDVGSAGGSSLLTGENLLMFLKSNRLAREVLLSPYDSAKDYSLADKYADAYKLRESWKKSKKIGKSIYFSTSIGYHFTRLQDSLIQTLADKIILKELAVDRPEKKATFVTVQTTIKDELLSEYFCERLVEKATERYIASKTKRQKANVDRLQRRADSIATLLNFKTYSNAVANEKILDVNPAYKSTTVNAEVVGRDKLMISTIYGEVVKNLEIAKVQLTQETPTIQIVDEVMLPLKIKKTSKLLMLLIGGIVCSALTIFYLTIIRFRNNPK